MFIYLVYRGTILGVVAWQQDGLEELLEIPSRLGHYVLYHRYYKHSDDSRNYVQFQSPSLSQSMVIVLETSIKVSAISLVTEQMGIHPTDVTVLVIIK